MNQSPRSLLSFVRSHALFLTTTLGFSLLGGAASVALAGEPMGNAASRAQAGNLQLAQVSSPAAPKAQVQSAGDKAQSRAEMLADLQIFHESGLSDYEGPVEALCCEADHQRALKRYEELKVNGRYQTLVMELKHEGYPD